MTLRGDLRELIATYQRLTGITNSALSNKLFGGGSRLSAFLAGGNLGIDVYERAIHWFTENWPKGHRADWPKGVRKRFVLMAIPPLENDRRTVREDEL